tara:strand:+ start:31162 stop:31788 length:627 start_codon:yes stop_codon:yes gene_type:complete
MARADGWVETKITYNGEADIRKMYSQMINLFDQVAIAYPNGKTNRGFLDIRYSLAKANKVIHAEVLKRAPVIRPEIAAKQSKKMQLLSLRDPKQTVARSAHSKKLMRRGIIARQVVTFRNDKENGSTGSYAAAIEFGRDPFMQVLEKKKHNVEGGDTDFFLRAVGAMKPQPFLIPAQRAKANQAMNVFAATLQKRWLTTLKKVASTRT